MRLASKPGGCVIWYDYDPATLELGPFRWFGTLPGRGLPDCGQKVARHAKADATGTKGLRAGHRVVTRSRFTEVPRVADLVPFLFGYDASDEIDLLRTSMSGQPGGAEPAWLHEVRSGNFDAIPSDLRWRDSVHFAHLIDGYRLATDLGLGDPFEFEERQLARASQSGRWAGGPAVLWTTLFLEHRRWRTASPIEPGPEMETLLDRLCVQLLASLKSS